jgi:arginine utilization protein RocB
VSRFWKETGDMLQQKTAQGAAELAQALNSQSNAYVPYGMGQQPLEVEGPSTSYTEMLREASQRAQPEQDRDLER